MFVLSNGLGDLLAGHTFKADGIGQTEAAFMGLPAAGGRRLVKIFIYPNHRAARQQVFEKGFDGLPAETALNQRPRFMDDIVGGEERPIFLFGAFKRGPRAGVK